MAWFQCQIGAGGGQTLIGGHYDEFFAAATLVPNTYIDEFGREVSYNNWTSTDYIELTTDADYIYRCGNLPNCNYNAFYDSNKTFISFFGSGTKQSVPNNAKYVRLSGENANVSGNLFMKVPFNPPVASGDEELFCLNCVGRDSAEIPQVQSLATYGDYSEYLSFDTTTRKFTVIKPFTAVFIPWVRAYNSSNGYPEGRFIVNGVEKANYQADRVLDAKGGATVILSMSVNDVFWVYTPSNNGWPEQHLKGYFTTLPSETPDYSDEGAS